jgi:predicted nucleic-acid-binding protein
MMRALDTNILGRYYVRHTDEDEYTGRQRAAAVRLLENEPALFVPRTVVLELEWLLRGRYQFTREQVASTLDHLLGLPQLLIEDIAMVEQALAHYRQGLDFADALHLAACREAADMLTFDERFAKRAGRLSLKPPCVAPV